MYKSVMILQSLTALSLLLLVMNVSATIAGKNLLTDQNIEIKSGSKGTAVVFMSAKCPCSNSHVEIVKKLSSDFKDFAFVVVHSNADEPLALAKDYFKAAQFSFPVIEDDKTKLADEFKALKTPHAFVLDRDGKILYKGGVTSSATGPTADKQFLREALTDVREGKAVRVADGRTLGCIIQRGRKDGF